MLAGLVFEGAMDGAAFEVFVARELAPQLRPGDVVVWDNLAVHKSAAARRLIEAAGAAIAWLPAYSPDLNRIEKAWSKIKTEARRAEARTTEGVKTAAVTAWRNVTPADCRSYVTSCGYDTN
ncbi:MAG: transposase [Planctomycetia bacterium]